MYFRLLIFNSWYSVCVIPTNLLQEWLLRKLGYLKDFDSYRQDWLAISMNYNQITFDPIISYHRKMILYLR